MAFGMDRVCSRNILGPGGAAEYLLTNLLQTRSNAASTYIPKGIVIGASVNHGVGYGEGPAFTKRVLCT
jgi:hypothetical protein